MTGKKIMGGYTVYGPSAIRQTTDGGYIVTGDIGLGDPNRFDFLVLKLNSDGTVDWQKTYGREDYCEFS